LIKYTYLASLSIVIAVTGGIVYIDGIKNTEDVLDNSSHKEEARATGEMLTPDQLWEKQQSARFKSSSLQAGSEREYDDIPSDTRMSSINANLEALPDEIIKLEREMNPNTLSNRIETTSETVGTWDETQLPNKNTQTESPEVMPEALIFLESRSALDSYESGHDELPENEINDYVEVVNDVMLEELRELEGIDIGLDNYTNNTNESIAYQDELETELPVETGRHKEALPSELIEFERLSKMDNHSINVNEDIPMAENFMVDHELSADNFQ